MQHVEEASERLLDERKAFSGDANTCVRVNREVGECVRMCWGVMQGYVMSLVSFNIFVHAVDRNINANLNNGVRTDDANWKRKSTFSQRMKRTFLIW